MYHENCFPATFFDLSSGTKIELEATEMWPPLIEKDGETKTCLFKKNKTTFKTTKRSINN